MRRRAAELGVSVSYWDWQGHEVTVPDETLRAIVTALESVPAADGDPAGVGGVAGVGGLAGGGGPAAEAVAPVPPERSWGFTVQLYSLRSRRSWGHGDLRDLADFPPWPARDLGAGFVLINPLHAAE